MDRCTAVLLSAALLWAATAAAAPQHKVYLTAQATDGVPSDKAATDFDCTDTIYAVIELTGASKNKHHLDAVWRDPAGKDRERTQHPFWVGRDQERIWVWLKLHRPTEAALVQFLNPSAGMDEFIGEWEIRLYLDEQPLVTQKFKVLC